VFAGLALRGSSADADSGALTGAVNGCGISGQRLQVVQVEVMQALCNKSPYRLIARRKHLCDGTGVDMEGALHRGQGLDGGSDIVVGDDERILGSAVIVQRRQCCPFCSNRRQLWMRCKAPGR
jgi:hypothetical protein